MTDILRTCFLWVIYSSISASIIALLILATKLIFKDRIRSRVYCMLWLLVIMKLITAPFAPGSPISVFNLFSQGMDQVSQPLPTALADLMARDRFEAASGVVHFAEPGEINNASMAENSESKLSDQNVSNSAAGHLDVVLIVTMIWMIVLLSSAGFMMRTGSTFRKRLKNSERIPASQLPEFLYGTGKRDIRADIEVYSSEHITTPCITGILKSKIYIPRQIATLPDRQQLAHILMHEYAHYKRWDNLTNVIIVAINIVHWFNPVLWYAMRQLKQDREVCCDAYALEMFGQGEAIPYGMTLINFCRCHSKRQSQFSFLSYCETKKQIERRIFMIKGFKKGTYKITAAAIILCLVLGSAIITNAAASTGNTNLTASSDTADKNSTFRIGGPSYVLSSLEKARSYSGFDFKVADFIPSSFLPYNIIVDGEAIDHRNLVTVTYNTKNANQYFQIMASEANLLKSMKTLRDKSFSYTLQEKSTAISGVKGTILTQVMETQSAKKSSNSSSTKNTKKRFIWTENGVWYAVLFYDFDQRSGGGSSLYCNISEKDLKQMVSSMKLPKDIKKVDYILSQTDGYMIYDEKDLAAAKKTLGFAPVFPLKLSCGYAPISSQVLKSTASDGKGTYCIETIFSPLKSVKKGDEKKAVFFQGKTTYVYEELSHNKTIKRTNLKNKKQEVFEVKSSQVDGTPVYSYIDSNAVTHNVWENKETCYILEIKDGIANKDSIVKELVSKTLK